jgi:hypothetical protein
MDGTDSKAVTLIVTVAGAVATLSVFVLNKAEQLVRYSLDQRDDAKKLRLLEIVANAVEPLNIHQLEQAAGLRFGLFRKRSLTKTQALCFRMVTAGVLSYGITTVQVGDLPPKPRTGYFRR